MKRTPLFIARALLKAAALFLLLGGLAKVPLHAQTVLQIGRADFPSPLSDIAETVITEAFKRSGLQLEVQKMPLLRSLAQANDGVLDGDLMRIADAVKNYSNLVAVPTPMVQADIALYGLDPKIVNAPRAEVIKREVGLTRGTLILVKHSQGMQVTDSQTISTTFDMLTNHRFDLAMLVFIDAELELARRELPQVLRRPHYWASEPLYFYLHKKHVALIPKLNATLQDMVREGLIKKRFLEGLKKYNIQPLKPAD